MTKPTDAQITLVANAIAYELNLEHADIRPHIERAAERAIAIVKETSCTKPTQAQIMREALEEIANHHIDSEFASLEKRNMAARALTAAAGKKDPYADWVEARRAEVGEPPKFDRDLVRRIIDAAEMSDGDTKELFLEAADSLVGWSSANKKMKNATIERCAQVADEYRAEQTGTASRIAAAIRAKSKP